MQSRRRRRHGAFLTAVDRLVAALVVIVRRPLDVRRQRHAADLLQPFHEDALVFKLHDARAVRSKIYNVGFEQRPVRKIASRPAEDHIIARLEPAARPHHDFPGVPGARPFDEQKLHVGAALLAGCFAGGVFDRFAAEEPRRNDFAVVEDEAVPFFQIFKDFEEVPVLDAHVRPAAVLVFVSMYDKKPGGIALLRRLLCY